MHEADESVTKTYNCKKSKSMLTHHIIVYKLQQNKSFPISVPTKMSSLRSIVLQITLWTSVLGKDYYYDDNSEAWVQNVRKLVNTGNFMQECNQIFVGDESLQHHSYLMSDFSREVEDLCSRFELDGGCPAGGFSGLPDFLQETFFQPIVGRILQGSRAPFPTKALIGLGDTGYIIPDRSMTEVDSIRNDFCVNLQGSFGGRQLRWVSMSYNYTMFIVWWLLCLSPLIISPFSSNSGRITPR